MEATVTTPPVKGIVIALLIIVFSMGLYFTGQIANQALGYFQVCNINWRYFLELYVVCQTA
jgi:hypothetical protein